MPDAVRTAGELKRAIARRVGSDPDYNRPNEGSIHQAATELFQTDEEVEAFIRILDVRQEPLGEMTDEDAQAEGDYETVEEFKEGWERLHGPGSWDPELVVDVVEFEFVGPWRPEDTDG